MSTGIFIKFSNFTGGSTNASYRDQFEASRFSWGIDVPGSISGQLVVGRATQRVFELKLPHQTGFTDLHLHSAKGTVVPTINIELTATVAQAPRRILRYDLTNTLITSVGLADDTGVGEDLLTVTLLSSRVVMSQFLYNPAGTLTTTKTATLDFVRAIYS